MRILSWNIQFFTLRRIDDNSGMDDNARADNLDRTMANLNYIIDTVEQSAADIFVVLEPRCSSGTVERLADGGGPDGLIYLLGQLRENLENDDWRLVPPLRLNPNDVLASNTYTECIGVFWANARLDFTGPYVWTTDGRPQPTGHGTPADYPNPWDAVVPQGKRAAGRCQFYYNNSTIARTFPETFNRRPFMTNFTERNVAQPRTVRLFTVHTSPSTARQAINRLSDIAELAPANGEFTVVIGDMNLDLNKLKTLDADALTSFSLKNFTQQPRSPAYGRVLQSSTRVRARPDATPARYFPSPGEMLDYAFVRYSVGTRPVNGPQFAIVDRVLGNPNPPFNTDMGYELAQFVSVQDQQTRNTLFRERWNYGHIAQPRRQSPDADAPGDGTSDHVPILFIV